MNVRDATDPWSVTTTALFDTLREQPATTDPPVLVTVVAVDRSAYRLPGAKMAVTASGEPIGAVTPGCLEDPVTTLAQEVSAAGTPRVEVFDLTDDDGTWGYGLGCNGVITVFLEPLGESFRTVLDLLDDGERVVAATVIDSDDPEVTVGARLVFDGDGNERNGSSHGLANVFGETLRSHVSALPAGKTEQLTLDTGNGEVTLFLDGMAPPPELLVFGHHGDVVSVVECARTAGFRTTVVAARGGSALDSRFAAADRFARTRPPEVATAVTDPTRTFAVLMSHNFIDDRLAFESLLETEVPYIGVMGPRKRFEQMRAEFDGEGVTLSEEDLARVSTPVGLDLAASEPTQIALSVVGEVLAVANGRPGGRLTERKGPVHPR
jgi:xanthine dehydrogenase accessory factor